MHLCWAYLFVSKLEIGLLGACYAMNITYFTLFIGITVYARFIPAI